MDHLPISTDGLHCGAGGPAGRRRSPELRRLGSAVAAAVPDAGATAALQGPLSAAHGRGLESALSRTWPWVKSQDRSPSERDPIQPLK